MTQDEFRAHRAELLVFLDLTHRFTALIALMTFAAYGLAGYLWWQKMPTAALILATAAYLVFRLFRPIVVRLARWRLSTRDNVLQVQALLEHEFRARKPQDVIAELEGYRRATAPPAGGGG